jgi:hypothetical protein
MTSCLRPGTGRGNKAPNHRHPAMNRAAAVVVKTIERDTPNSSPCPSLTASGKAVVGLAK